MTLRDRIKRLARSRAKVAVDAYNRHVTDPAHPHHVCSDCERLSETAANLQQRAFGSIGRVAA